MDKIIDMKKLKPLGLFEELNEPFYELKSLLVFLKSLGIPKTHDFAEAELSIEINKKVGGLHVYNEDHIIVVEGDNLKYTFPAKMTYFVVQGLTKVIK